MILPWNTNGPNEIQVSGCGWTSPALAIVFVDERCWKLQCENLWKATRFRAVLPKLCAMAPWGARKPIQGVPRNLFILPPSFCPSKVLYSTYLQLLWCLGMIQRGKRAPVLPKDGVSCPPVCLPCPYFTGACERQFANTSNPVLLCSYFFFLT